MIEPEIGRKFAILVSEDDFSDEGALEYKPASINGKETDIDQIYSDLSKIAKMITEASVKRDKLMKK